MEKYLSISEAAEILGKSKETLRRWDKSGKFKSLRHPINQYRVYPEAQVLSVLEDIQLELSYSKNEAIESKPIFKTEFGKLYNLDVVEFLNSQASESVDLIFADPPYNIKKAEWDTFSSQKEYVDWSMRWIREAARVLKPTGSLYICGFSEILADIKWAASPLFKGCKWLVWYYRNKANLGKDWGRSHESILHFRKGKNFIFNLDEVRIPYNEHTIKYPKRTQADSSQYSKANNNPEKYEWEPNPLGAKPKDVLEIPTLSNGSWERYTHETQKPVELLRKIVLSSSNPKSLIVDPFGGSGTTYAVSEAFQRSWLGNEINEKYCEMIQKRVSDINHLERILLAKDEIEAKRRRIQLRG